jgi:hypothetical protein
MTALKSLVVCLALANVGYFLWIHTVAKSQDDPVAAAPSKSLKLVSEVPEGARAAVDGESGLAGASGGRADAAAGSESPSDGNGAGVVSTATRCMSVGPFRDVAETARAAGTLRAGGYNPQQRVADGDIWEGVWVYVPIPSSPAAVDPLLARLKAAGIDDALEMPGPAEGSGSVISLGLFSDQKRAQVRVAQAQALGLEPTLADRKRTGNVYWIDIDLKPADRPLTPAILQGGTGRISRLEVKACPAPGATP